MNTERVTPTPTAPITSTQTPARTPAHTSEGRTLYRCPELADLLEEMIGSSGGGSIDGELEPETSDDSEMDWVMVPFAGGRTVTFVPVEAEPLA